MARNTADLRDEIMIRDRSLLSAYAWLFVHRSSNLSDFLRIFCHRPGRGERRVDSRPSSASKVVLRFFLSSIPRHRLCLYLATSVLTLIPGDPSTRVVALITCRKCFSSMREKGSPSRRIGVFRFVFSFYFSLFSFFSFGGEHLAGSVGYSGTCK